MQATMSNMMEEWMKNFNGLKAFPFPQNMDFLKSLNISKIGLQVLDFQKSMIDNSFEMLAKIHEQEDKVMDNFSKGLNGFPAESFKMFLGWYDMTHKGQDEFKKAIDDGFKQSETLLAAFDQESNPKATKTPTPAKSSN